jgi:MFS family permease
LLGGLRITEANRRWWVLGTMTGSLSMVALDQIGAALMVPATGSQVLNFFAPDERGRATGIYSGVSMIFLALGPLIGGVLTEAVSWRAVFFVNLPVGALMLAAAHFTLPPDRLAEDRGAIDWLGLPVLVGGLGALVLGLMQGATWAGPRRRRWRC